MLFLSWIPSQVSLLLHYRTSLNKSQLFSVIPFLSSNTNWIPVQLMKIWYHKRHLNPVRFILSILRLCVSNAQAFHNCSFKLYFLKYIFTNYFSKKPSDSGSLVLPKAQECPTLTVAAYVDLGPCRDQKEGLYTQTFMRILWDFIN